MKKFLAAATAVVFASVVATSSAVAQVNVIATTTGCFYTTPDAPCTSGLTNTNLSGLIDFTGGAFNVIVGPGANHNFDGDLADNIGLLHLIGSPATLGNSFLRVFVSFQSPSLGAPSDIVVGDFNFLNNSGDPRLQVIFSQTYDSFQYGPNPLQAFEFRGYEGSPSILREGDSQYLGFRIDCVDGGTAACLAPPAGNVGEFTTTTPEPSTYALMGAGLLGLAGVARRRNRNAK